MALTQQWALSMSGKDKRFYQELGTRMAEARKGLGMTQTQLAEQLGISQQTLAHYEVGRLRISVELLTTLAHTLNVHIEQLIEESPPEQAAKRGPTPKLQQQMEQISLLPRAKQKFVSEMLDRVIQHQV